MGIEGVLWTTVAILFLGSGSLVLIIENRVESAEATALKNLSHDLAAMLRQMGESARETDGVEENAHADTQRRASAWQAPSRSDSGRENSFKNRLLDSQRELDAAMKIGGASARRLIDLSACRNVAFVCLILIEAIWLITGWGVAFGAIAAPILVVAILILESVISVKKQALCDSLAS